MRSSALGRALDVFQPIGTHEAHERGRASVFSRFLTSDSNTT